MVGKCPVPRRLGVKRGDVAIVAPPGEFGKPRPALIIQSDITLPSPTVTYLPITSGLLLVPNTRILLLPSPANGLRLESEVMIDMIQTSSLGRFGQVVGHVDALTMIQVEAALSMHLGLVDGAGPEN